MDGWNTVGSSVLSSQQRSMDSLPSAEASWDGEGGGKGVLSELSWGSLRSAATKAPYTLSPPRSPTFRPPHKSWQERSGRFEMTPWERPEPHSLGVPVPSVVVTPDLILDRWPARETSTVWRGHARPGATKTTFPSPWYQSVIASETPRGYPAPGGGPNQHPRWKDTALTARTSERPLRPFTHASSEAARELLVQAKERVWLNDRPAAVPLLEKALTIEPNFPDALALLGKLRTEDRQEHVVAEELLKKALLLDPENVTALGCMAGMLENHEGEHDLAEELYEKAISISPQDATLLTNYAVFIRKMRSDQPKARQLMLRAFQLQPKHPWLKENAHKF